MTLSRSDKRCIIDQESDVRTDTRGGPLSRRSLIRWLLGFSVVSMLGGVLTPVVGYRWPTARARSNQGGRTLVGAESDFSLNSGRVVPVNDEPVINAP
jgi:hypothetical protein